LGSRHPPETETGASDLHPGPETIPRPKETPEASQRPRDKPTFIQTPARIELLQVDLAGHLSDGLRRSPFGEKTFERTDRGG
tara:strand:+ start:158 stop:403 length:246 start_codon:yes stop_codon:yes gene_type:complete